MTIYEVHMPILTIATLLRGPFMAENQVSCVRNTRLSIARGNNYQQTRNNLSDVLPLNLLQMSFHDAPSHDNQHFRNAQKTINQQKYIHKNVYGLKLSMTRYI